MPPIAGVLASMLTLPAEHKHVASVLTTLADRRRAGIGADGVG